MSRVEDDNKVKHIRQPKSGVPNGFRGEDRVAVPLDFLQGLSSIAYRSLERRPPRLKLKPKQKVEDQDELQSLSRKDPIVSKETSEIAYRVAEIVVRRKAQIEQSGSLPARRGLTALERMTRMFEHVYISSSNPSQHEEFK
ncbi:hypothetical protein F9L33_09545 [Amylibacter sp. SFDW26]|uniref:hypothetical protein n=1 Tax=Amylibacter sp. SFDW26 TaxID=2652722 RepID=UPI0012624856|nr:hypothetical protein [Amylibacter sp. SFDW26]KAB7613614.1 hypothetical protein F9L33_09545 [Amylibacter sp. SFDW26]